LNVSAAASPRGSTVEDPDTVTFSCARVGAIDPMKRAINRIVISLLMISPRIIVLAEYVQFSFVLNLKREGKVSRYQIGTKPFSSAIF
jgi:hypothetical protein